MGIYPESFLAPMRQDVTYLLQRVERVTPAGDSQPTAGKEPLKVVDAGGEHE